MLQASIHSFLNRQGYDRPYCIAYSGGLDSQVLLDLCVQRRKQTPFLLRVIHIHHGLSPHADQWLAHCKAECERYQVEFIHYGIDASPVNGESVEEAARRKRYEQLAKVLYPEEIVLTAHHQDDQAETVLLQLLRGAGPKGLSAMPRIKVFGRGLQGRPLLDFTRAELQSYAESQKLSWIEDEMNADSQYSRNFLRHEILPLLQKRWPTVTAAIARVADNCAEAQGLLDAFALRDIVSVAGEKPNTLSVKRLLELEPQRQRFILRYWFEQQGALLPSAVKLQQILSTVLLAKEDRVPCVQWGKVELRRYQDELYLLPIVAPHDNGKIFSWRLAAPLAIPGIGELQASLISGQGLRSEVEAVEVRFRQGGEVYAVAKGQHHELKKFFQEQGIPPWLRDRLPLVYVQEELAAIPGYLLVDKFKARPGEEGYELRLSRPTQ